MLNRLSFKVAFDYYPSASIFSLKALAGETRAFNPSILK